MEKCVTCGTEFELEELIDWASVGEDMEISGQETACPECGEPIWIASWEIEDILDRLNKRMKM